MTGPEPEELTPCSGPWLPDPTPPPRTYELPPPAHDSTGAVESDHPDRPSRSPWFARFRPTHGRLRNLIQFSTSIQRLPRGRPPSLSIALPWRMSYRVYDRAASPRLRRDSEPYGWDDGEFRARIEWYSRMKYYMDRTGDWDAALAIVGPTDAWSPEEIVGLRNIRRNSDEAIYDRRDMNRFRRAKPAEDRPA